MLELYGKLYAPHGAPYVDYVREGLNGTFQKEPGGLVLIDLDGKERAFIRRDGLGPVSLAILSDGSRYYMHATSTKDELWLNTPKSYTAECAGAKEAARAHYSPILA